MDKNKQTLSLLAIFLVVSAVSVYIGYGSNYFSDDKSYYSLRQVQSIISTGKPLSYDALSYGGTDHVFMPLQYYLLVPPYLIGGIQGIKIFLNLVMSACTIIVYVISHHISRNRKAALYSALLSGFIPIILFRTTNEITLYPILIMLSLSVLYYFMKVLKKPDNLQTMLILLFLLVFYTPLSIIVIFSMLIYQSICYLEKIRIERRELELSLFSLFFYSWANLVVFKRAFRAHGLSAIWQNLPEKFLQEYFYRITPWEAVFSLGLIPLICGLISVYNYLFKIKSKKNYMIISILVSSMLLSWLRIISIIDALVFSGIALTILSSLFFKQAIVYFQKTKFEKFASYFDVLVIILIMVFSALPAIQYALIAKSELPVKKDLEVFFWLKNNTPERSVVASTLTDGMKIAYFAQRKNIMDTEFLLRNDVEQRSRDIAAAYETNYKVNALESLQKYSTDYILITEAVREKFGIDSLPYADDVCFRLVYNETDKVYSVECELE